LVSVVTMAVRIAWVFAGAYWMNFSQKRKNRLNKGTPEIPDGTWKNVLVVAWTGTRGVISLAAALAIPLVLAEGAAFPQRHAIIFLTFVVIFVTLVVQGLTLPLLIRLLKIKTIPSMDPEEKELKLLLATSTYDFIEHELDLSHDHQVHELLIKKYEKMIRELTKDIRRQEIAKAKDLPLPAGPPDALLGAQLAINTFQRSLLLRLHKEGEFSDATIRLVEREMDINELKLNLQVPGE
jgi:NhaP-type Na+/H+ or K+/H+ antiporter